MNIEDINIMYTDDNGEKHPGMIQDTMPGKNGFTGIVYWDRKTPESDAVEVFEFVENDRWEFI